MELSGAPFTVVVADDDDDGLLARELAHQWHADGLLGEFAWVSTGDVFTGGYGPATIHASVIGQDPDARVELMTLLGARPRSLLRIVVLHLLTHERSSAVRLVESCDEIAGQVHRAMPLRVEEAGGRPGTRLLRINLMVPESDVLAQEPDLIEPTWEVNAIVSPEDRPDLDRMSVFVRQSVNLHGHALAATASVAGLWADSAVGAFDDHQADSSTAPGDLMVVRCQARIVAGDDRGQQLSARVVDRIQNSPAGAAPWLTWGVLADDPPAAVRQAADKLMVRPEWAPSRRRVEPLEKAQVSLGTLMRNWALFQLQLPLAVLAHLTGLGRSMVEQAITRATVGRGAGEVGRVHPLTPDQAREVAEFRMRTLSEELEPGRLGDEAARWGQTTPTAWRELRELAVGLVDGSRLPDGFSRAARGGLEEVLPPAFVVPEPGDDFAKDDRTVSSVDVATAATLLREEEEAAAAASKDSTSPAPPSALSEWVSRRRNSLLWEMAQRVHDLRSREQTQAATAGEALSGAAAPSTGRLQTAQTLVLVAWSIAFLALLLLVLWLGATAWDDPFGLLSRIPGFSWDEFLVALLVVLLLLLLAGTNYFQALRTYEWQVTVRLHDLRQASDEYVAARQQEKRWALMYHGLQDWATVLAELLHRPWQQVEPVEEGQGKYAALPAAVAVAVPVEGDEGPDARVVTRAVEKVCQKGWLDEEFERLVAASPSNDPAAQPHVGDLPADLDLGLRPNGPREELAQVAALPTSKAAASRVLMGGVTELLRQGDVRMPPQTVTRVGPYSVGDKVVDREFLGGSTDVVSPLAPELFHPGALLARRHLPERSVFCLPMGLPGPRIASAAVHYCGVSVATRVDVTPLLRPSDITMFAPIQRAQPRSDSSADDFN